MGEVSCFLKVLSLWLLFRMDFFSFLFIFGPFYRRRGIVLNKSSSLAFLPPLDNFWGYHNSKLLADFLAIDELYLRAASLHLRLIAFFDSPTSKDYHLDLQALWISTTSFLECAFGLETTAGVLLIHSTNYILQMIIAAGFSLLKLLNSFFACHVDLVYGRSLFNQTIWAIRSISVITNDLPSRLAEVLAQLWRGGGAGLKIPRESSSVDSSLQLKVKCRMSMSLVYDSVWRWREEFQAQGRGNLESWSHCPKFSVLTLKTRII